MYDPYPPSATHALPAWWASVVVRLPVVVR
jgi:hypothetical protein